MSLIIIIKNLKNYNTCSSIEKQKGNNNWFLISFKLAFFFSFLSLFSSGFFLMLLCVDSVIKSWVLLDIYNFKFKKKPYLSLFFFFYIYNHQKYIEKTIKPIAKAIYRNKTKQKKKKKGTNLEK
jgi:hypothetical protein